MHRDTDKGHGATYLAGWDWRNEHLGFRKKGKPSGGRKHGSVGNGTVSCGIAGENEWFGAVILWRNCSCDLNPSQFAMWSLLVSPLCVSVWENPVASPQLWVCEALSGGSVL